MLSVLGLSAQEKEKSSFRLTKVGLLYNQTTEDNFIFNDPDYYYTTKTLKAQFYFPLLKKEKWDFDLVMQPQVQHSEHQLINEFFVTPDEDNYLENRERFTQRKTLTLVGFELGFLVKFLIVENLNLEFNAGLGAGYIDVETERLAKGFTFFENLSLGFAYQVEKSEFYLGANLGHISNLDFQMPNSGYNLLGFEISYRYYLE